MTREHSIAAAEREAEEAHAHHVAGRTAAAIAANLRALEHLAGIEGVTRLRVGCLSGLATAYRAAGDLRRSLEANERALRELGDAGDPRDQASLLINTGNVQKSLREAVAAERSYRRALALLDGLDGVELATATCLTNLGDLLGAEGRRAPAMEAFRRALHVCATVDGSELQQADVHAHIADLLVASGDARGAERAYVRALAAYECVEGTDWDQARCHADLGALRADLGDADLAEQNLTRAVRLYEPFESAGRRVSTACLMLADLQLARGDAAAADRSCRTAEHLWEQGRTTPVDHVQCALCRTAIALTTGDLAGAERALVWALRAERELDIPQLRANAYKELGLLCAAKGELAEGEEATRHALALFEAIEGTEFDQAGCLQNLGDILRRRRSTGHAQEALRRARELYLRLERPGDVARVDHDLALLLGSGVIHVPERDLIIMAPQQRVHEAVSLAVRAMAELDHRRYALRTERERGLWAANVAARSLGNALRLAAWTRDAQTVADLIAVSRTSGPAVMAAPFDPSAPSASAPLDAPDPASASAPDPASEEGGSAAARPTADEHVPALTAGTSSLVALGLDALFRRRPAPALEMPGGRIALGDHLGGEPRAVIRYR